MKWRAHWLLPNIVPSPHRYEEASSEQRDRESNETSRVPEEEELRLRVVWGIELFGPSEVEGLCDQLRRLNWTAGFGRPVGEAVDWVRHQRAYGEAGAWYNVGLVTERGDRKRFLMVDNYAPMPNGVDYLHVRIYQLTSSLTCVLIGFVFKESVERIYETELKQDRRTIRERSESRWGISIVDPRQLKKRSLKKARAKARAIAHKWFTANLPGFFCNLPGERMPTAELVTMTSNNLLPVGREQRTNAHYDWRNLLANTSGYDVRASSDCVGLRFAIGDKGWIEDTPHMVIAMCTSEVPEDTLKHRGGHERHAYVAYCHDKMGGILSNYAALEFLREASKDLKISRAALTLRSAARRKAVRALEKIQAFFDRSLGTPAIVAELLDRSKHVHYYKQECERFFSPGWKRSDVRREFGIVLCEQTQFLAAKVISEERSMREHFEQLSTVLSVRESVRAQKRMEWLAVFALVVAAASLFVALPPIKDWPDATKTLLHGLSDHFQRTRSAD
ncbi:hypothetical protein [Achromobacter xylosoxidans]|uniref:hypothetical protein n=1 Tax=Alcaligenes xylosoxydans xylosoxydans TaxID=85698 RepID=UPI003CFFA7A4